MTVSFTTTTTKDAGLIRKIVNRANTNGLIGESYDRMTAHMDITAVHANGCPLRLSDLLAADDFNFAHDVAGIARHIDRETGKLEGGFLPRFAA